MCGKREGSVLVIFRTYLNFMIRSTRSCAIGSKNACTAACRHRGLVFGYRRWNREKENIYTYILKIRKRRGMCGSTVRKYICRHSFPRVLTLANCNSSCGTCATARDIVTPFSWLMPDEETVLYCKTCYLNRYFFTVYSVAAAVHAATQPLLPGYIRVH